MNHIEKAPWTRWVQFWQIALAVVVGLCLFVFLDVASAGIFYSAAIVGMCFAVLASAHYLVWGRAYSSIVDRQRLATPSRLETIEKPRDEFVVDLSEQERKELLELLQRSQAEHVDGDKRALRRELLNKLWMFGG